MKEYTAVYLDDKNKLLKIQESLKNLENSKISKIYNSPSLESIEEQVQVAKLQNCDTLNIILSDLVDRVGMEEDLNTLYGSHFSGGIRLLPLEEDEITPTPNPNPTPVPPSPESKPNMLIFNPFGTLLFNKNGKLHDNVVTYISGAFDFIEKYADKCKAIYFIDSRVDNIRATQPNITLAVNWSWLKTNSSNLSVQGLEDFFFYNENEKPARFENLRIIRDVYKTKSDISKVRIPKSYIYMDYEMFTALNDVGLRGFATDEFNLIGSNVGLWAKDKQGAGVSIDVKSPYENEISNRLSDIKNEIDVALAEGTANESADSLSTESSDFYMFLLLQLLDTHPIALESIKASKNGTPLVSRSSNKYTNDRMYKNQKLDRVNKDYYWGGSDYQIQTDKFQKAAAKNIDKYLLNKEVDGDRFTDKTLEKFYNLKYFPKDFLGISTDNEMERFNYKRYDSDDKKVPGVAGIQIYKLEKRKNEIAKEIDEINLEIEELDDSEYEDSEEIKRLNDAIKELSDEEDDIEAILDSSKRDVDARNKINKVNADNNLTDENGELINDMDTEEINRRKAVYATLAIGEVGNSIKELMVL